MKMWKYTKYVIALLAVGIVSLFGWQLARDRSSTENSVILPDSANADFVEVVDSPPPNQSWWWGGGDDGGGDGGDDGGDGDP